MTPPRYTTGGDDLTLVYEDGVPIAEAEDIDTAQQIADALNGESAARALADWMLTAPENDSIEAFNEWYAVRNARLKAYREATQ